MSFALVHRHKKYKVQESLEKEIRDKEQKQPYFKSAKQRGGTYYLNSRGCNVRYCAYLHFLPFIEKRLSVKSCPPEMISKQRTGEPAVYTAVLR